MMAFSTTPPTRACGWTTCSTWSTASRWSSATPRGRRTCRQPALAAGIKADDLLIHDERSDDPTLAFLLSRLVHEGNDELAFPEVAGVLRAVNRPVHHQQLDEQISTAVAKRGKGVLQELLTGDETWTIE
ncbi:MAG: hypothetical protein U0736_09335 [Gemmataceae bacterium]